MRQAATERATHRWWAPALTGVLVAGLTLGPGHAARAAWPPILAKLDLGTIRQPVGQAVCSVTIENTWGIQTAVTTGFLLGDGRFAVTDLGAFADPGVAKATLHFSDGTRLACAKFGLADPALGLVALRIDYQEPSRPGLPLAPRLPSLDGLGAVAAAGWQWGKELTLVEGRLWRGPAIRDVAARSRVNTPAGVETFLRMDGGRIQAASGSPVLDDTGTVLAVRLDVAARNVLVALAMPAASLRDSLLSTKPTLRPLADLPEPLWPVQVLRLRGEPTGAAPFLQVTKAIRTGSICPECKGKGTIRKQGDGLLGRLRREDVPCPTCGGETVAVDAGLFRRLGTWAEQGTRVVWAPVMEERARATIRSAGAEMLKYLAMRGRQFRRAYDEAAGEELSRRPRPPRGIVFFGQVRDTVTGPDGRYYLLEALNARTLVAVRADDLAGRGGKGPTAPRRQPGETSWIVLAGTILSHFESGTCRGLFVLPFEWMPAPPPGPLPPQNR